MKAIPRLLAGLLMLLFGADVAPAAESPDALVKSTTEEVLSVIKKTNDRNTLRRLAEQKVLPYFDFKEMTRLAAGRAWRDATPEQQKKLEEGFRSLIVNTYTSALSKTVAADKTVEVKPLQAGANDKEVTVRTLVKGGGAQPLAIDYRMQNTPQGWKVFDVIVENVSLVTTYRGSFKEEVQRAGIDGLIKTLQDKNRSLARS
jgi:phospholipid transport system substrate-binding protein